MFSCFRSKVWFPLHRRSSSSKKQNCCRRVLWVRYHRDQRWTHEWIDEWTVHCKKCEVELLLKCSLSSSSIAAYNFGFDASTAHAELKVQGDTVTWEPQGVKGHDLRLRGKESKSRWGNVSLMMSSGVISSNFIYICV